MALEDQWKITCYATIIPLAPFASPQPHSLSILLEFRNQRIPMLHRVSILLVLVVRSIRLNHPVDSIDRACDAVAGDELGQITVARQ